MVGPARAAKLTMPFPQMPNAAAPSGHFQPLAAHTSDIQFVFQGYHGGNLGVNLV